MDSHLDYNKQSTQAFDQLADRYQDAFMDLSPYHASYRFFCDQIKSLQACVLDVACGPGHGSRFLINYRAELDLLGIDLAPRMIELAGQNVPEARFLVYDCRQLEDLKQSFDGILCAFGLRYYLICSKQTCRPLFSPAQKS